MMTNSDLEAELLKHQLERRGGFEPDPTPEICRHREHNAPTHMVIPQGQQYRHICPGCGNEIVLRPLRIS